MHDCYFVFSCILYQIRTLAWPELLYYDSREKKTVEKYMMHYAGADKNTQYSFYNSF